MLNVQHLVFVGILVLVTECLNYPTIKITSQDVSELKEGCVFKMNPQISNNRAIYEGCSLYLYNQIVSEGIARWIIGDKILSTSLSIDDSMIDNDGKYIMWIDSWALNPQTIDKIYDKPIWKKATTSVPRSASLTISYKKTDTTLIYLKTNFPKLNGFYVETGKVISDRTVYIKDDLFLYYSMREGKERWIISHKLDDMKDIICYIDSKERVYNLKDSNWFIMSSGAWKQTPFRIFNETQEKNIFQVIRQQLGVRTGSDYELYNGLSIPLVGFGTTHLVSPITSIGYAISAGYKLIDVSPNIEDNFAEILKKKNREDFFIVAKVPPPYHGFNETLIYFDEILSKLDTWYIDLFILKNPFCSNDEIDCYRNDNTTWSSNWVALEKLYSEGKVLSIGVSEFKQNDFSNLITKSLIKPHVIQDSEDPLDEPLSLLYCHSNNIHYQSYSRSLAKYKDNEYNKAIMSIAKKLQKTPSQIVLRYLIQRGIGILPSSDSQMDIESNFDIFEWKLTFNEIDFITAGIQQPNKKNNIKIKNLDKDSAKIIYHDYEFKNIRHSVVEEQNDSNYTAVYIVVLIIVLCVVIYTFGYKHIRKRFSQQKSKWSNL